MTALPFYWHYANMTLIPYHLRAFGIRLPSVPRGFRCKGYRIGVGTDSELTPTTRRHSGDNVGAGFLACVVFTFQGWVWWILAANLGARVFVRVLRSCIHQHKLVGTRHCKTDFNILVEKYDEYVTYILMPHKMMILYSVYLIFMSQIMLYFYIVR